MTIYVICGPVGSKLKQFALDLGKTWGKESGTLEFIDEGNYMEIIPDSNPERFKLNAERMLQVIQKADSDDIIIYGHHIFSNELLRNMLTTVNLHRKVYEKEPENERIIKAFLETDADTLLVNYIRGHGMLMDVGVVLDDYETVIKPQNELEILPSKKFADIVIPGYPINNSIYKLLHDSSRVNSLAVKNSRVLTHDNSGVEEMTANPEERCEDSYEERSSIGFFG